MKCVLTGKETKNKMKNIPMSREGRQQVKDYLERFRTSELPHLGFVMSIKMAMDDLFQGRDILEEYTEVKEKAEGGESNES